MNPRIKYKQLIKGANSCERNINHVNKENLSSPIVQIRNSKDNPNSQILNVEQESNLKLKQFLS